MRTMALQRDITTVKDHFRASWTTVKPFPLAWGVMKSKPSKMQLKAKAALNQTNVNKVNHLSCFSDYDQQNRLTKSALQSTIVARSNAPHGCRSYVDGDKEYPAVTRKKKWKAQEETAEVSINTQ